MFQRFFTAVSIFLLTAINSTLLSNTIYEAEDAVVIYNGVIEDEHTGFTGTGYVNVDNEVGSYFELVVNMAEAGEQAVTIYFANGAAEDRNMDFYVNGVLVAEEVSFLPTGAWTTWNTTTVNIPFNAGGNLLRLTSITSDGGPNIDKLEISGEPGEPYYYLKTEIFGEGDVSTEPADPNNLYKTGSEVTLIANPDAGFVLGGWRGHTLSKENPLTLTIDSHHSINAIFLRAGLVAKTDEQTGWMNVGSTVTGGQGGTAGIVTTQSQLESLAGSSDYKIIQVSGTIELTPFGKKIDVSSNTSIVGLDNDATIKGGGFRIKDATNVIIQNLHFRDAFVDWEGKTTDNDAIEINNSQHIWINRCDFSHYDDGLIDIKNASDLITISWCRFHNHNKVILIGVDDGNTQDIGKNNVTIHHCWFDGRFGNGIGQRLPRVRFGKVHVFNNFYQDVSISGVMVGYDGEIYIENCYFLNVRDPHSVVGGAGGGDNKMNVTGNIFINSPGRKDTRGTTFSPTDFYSYAAHDAEDVPALVMLGAGVVPFTEIGHEIPTAFQESVSGAKKSFSMLEQNYPNPFSSKTNIEYTLSESARVKLEVLDLAGKSIAVLVDGEKQPGRHVITFDGTGIKPGIYFYRFIANNRIEMRRMAVVR